MEGTVCLISLHFSPAYISLLIGYGRAFALLGHSIKYVLHPSYMAFPEFKNNPLASASTTYDGDLLENCAHALFTNMASKNHVYAGKLRREGCNIWYIYHEPWESFSMYRDTESLPDILKLFIAHRLSIKMLKASDLIVLPSQCCLRTYEKGDAQYNSNYYKVPLLFDDDSCGIADQNRQYFAYIGNISKSHGFDQFMRFVKHSIQNNLGIRFLVASRSPFPQAYINDITIAGSLDQLTINCGHPLSTDEINLCYASSICVWNIYRRSTQSGVLGKAMMFGTPVLASRVGSFGEFITDKIEGRMLEGTDPLEINAAYSDINEHLSSYTSNCRARFLSTYFYKSHLEALRRMLAIEPSKQSS